MQKELRPLNEVYVKHQRVAWRWISGGAGQGSAALPPPGGWMPLEVPCSGGLGTARGGARLGSPDPEAPYEMFLMTRIRNCGLQTEETSAG